MEVKNLIESIQTFCRDTGVSVEQLLAQTNTRHYTVSRPRGLAKEHPGEVIIGADGHSWFSKKVPAKSGSTRFMWVRDAPVAVSCGDERPKVNCLDGDDNVAPVVAKRGPGRPKKVDGVDNVEAPVAAKRCPGIPPKLDSEDNVEAPVVAKRGRGRPKKVDGVDNVEAPVAAKRGRGRPKKVDGEKAERKSPTTKAKDVGLGAKEIGNDGNDWEVVQRGTEDSKRGLFLVWKQVA